MQVVGAPNPDYPGRRHDNLWLLVGGDPYTRDLAMAYYIGVDLDEDRVDIAGHVLEDVIAEHGLDADEARQALDEYRASIAAGVGSTAAVEHRPATASNGPIPDNDRRPALGKTWGTP